MSFTLRTVARRAGPSSITINARALSTSAPVAAPPTPKRKLKAKAARNPTALPLEEAVRVLRALEIANPSSAFSLDILTKVTKGAALLRGRVALPTDPRRTPDLIVVFAEPDSPSGTAAREAGAHVVGGPELFPKILGGEIVPTKVLATPSMLPALSRSLARFLGPKGIMPVVKRGTVGEGPDLGRLVREASGTLQYRADKHGVVCVPIARMTFGAPAIQENVRALIAAVREQSATSVANDVSFARTKNTSPLTKVVLSTTQGPGIELTDVI